MIQRVVMIRLKPEFRNDESRAQVAAHTLEVLPKVPMVQSIRANTPADGRAARDWDLCLLVELEDLAAVEAYRDEPTHRAYVDVYLKPMLDKIRVWNFNPAG